MAAATYLLGLRAQIGEQAFVAVGLTSSLFNEILRAILAKAAVVGVGTPRLIVSLLSWCIAGCRSAAVSQVDPARGLPATGDALLVFISFVFHRANSEPQLARVCLPRRMARALPPQEAARQQPHMHPQVRRGGPQAWLQVKASHGAGDDGVHCARIVKGVGQGA